MNWWAVGLFGVCGLLGLATGWIVGTILSAFKNEPWDIWEDWED